MRDGIDRRDLDAALPSRPVLNPCVILGFGPTAAEALTAAQARIHTHLKGIPPFHAFLTMEQKDGQVSCSLQLGGAQVAPVWKHAPSPAPLADAARWLEYALGRVTESWRNLEHSVYHGSRNDFERVELIVVAALEELDSLESLAVMVREVGVRFPACWRMGVIWTASFADLMPIDQDAAQTTITARLAALDIEQQRAGVMAPEPLFETCFILGSPATAGLRTLRSLDVVDLTAAFLGYALASNFALPLRRFIQPHKGTWQTHFGLLARRYDTQELMDALNRIWLSAVITVLDAPLTEPIQAVAATESLAIGSLLPGTVEEAEQAVSAWVEATKTAASQLSSVSPNVSGSYGTSGADGVVRLLPRVETILRDQVKAILMLRNNWQREQDDQRHRLEQWKLTPKPEPFIHVDDVKERVINRSWLWLLLLPFGPCLWWAWDSGSAGFFWTAVACAVVAVFAILRFLPQKFTQSERKTIPNPEYESHGREGREISRRHELATYMVTDPEAWAETHSVRSDPKAQGLWRAACELGQWHRELMLLRHALRQQANSDEESDSWFVRNIISPGDLQTLLARALSARLLGGPNAFSHGSSATTGADQQVLPTIVREALGPSGLKFLFDQDHQAVLQMLMDYGNQLFANYKDLSLGEMLSLLGHNHPSGLDGPSVFFNTLARGAVMLWPQSPAEVNGEYNQILYSDPWDDDLAHRACEIVGQCEASRENLTGEIALIRVSRGKQWFVPQTKLVEDGKSDTRLSE